MNLKDKVIAITGGTKGLGLSIAKMFAEKGAKVAICSRDIQNIENFLVFKADVTDESQLSAFAKKIISQFGRIDIVMISNNLRNKINFNTALSCPH